MSQRKLLPAQSSQAPILDESHLTVLNQVLSEGEAHKRELERFRAAGTPMEPLEQQVAALLEVAAGYKRTFFPNSD